MPDRRNLKSLDRLDAPDLWPEIEGREPGRPVSLAPSPLRRVGTALLALAIAAGAITLAVVAFGGGKGSAPVATSPFAPETTSAVPRPENGDVLVYARPGPDETVQLFVVPADGGEPRQLTHVDGTVVRAAVSPDGSLVAYAAAVEHGADVRTIRWDGTDDRLVCAGCANYTAFAGSGGESGISVGDRTNAFAFLPDGRLVVALFDASGVAIREGDRVIASAAGERGTLDSEIAIAPDGSSVVWRRQHPGTKPADARPDLDGLYLLDAATGETRQLTSQDGPPFTYDPDSEPAWSPDGQWIAFVRGIASFGPGGLETGRTYGIWVVRPDGSDMHAVTTTKSETVYPMTPAWSPDGRSIAYVVVDRGRTEVHAIEADGTGDRTVVSFSCPDADTACGPARGSLSWSPDGTSLLFGIEETVQAPADSYVLPSGTYVVNANGSALHQVGASLGDSRPVGWAPAAPEPTAGS